jgi:hypothetical protein
MHLITSSSTSCSSATAAAPVELCIKLCSQLCICIHLSSKPHTLASWLHNLLITAAANWDAASYACSCTAALLQLPHNMIRQPASRSCWPLAFCVNSICCGGL